MISGSFFTINNVMWSIARSYVNSTPAIQWSIFSLDNFLYPSSDNAVTMQWQCSTYLYCRASSQTTQQILSCSMISLHYLVEKKLPIKSIAIKSIVIIHKDKAERIYILYYVWINTKFFVTRIHYTLFIIKNNSLSFTYIINR